MGANALFLGTELHQNRSLHLHGLYRGVRDNHIPSNTIYSSFELWDRLFKVFGRSSVSAVTSQEKVARYCTKYVTKALTEYYIL